MTLFYSRRLFAQAGSIAAIVAVLPLAGARAQSDFALRKGDRIVFYGDSITAQRQYTVFVEDYLVTRFPGSDFTFVHSGWGGDRVTGGGGGPIDTRIDRDVLAYKPTVVTVMLGMNDANYSAFNPNDFRKYATGYEHLVSRIKAGAPQARLTLIQPSPYDDVTRAPGFPGGYNGTLLRYSDYVKELAQKEGARTADLNKPVVAMLEKANKADDTTAQKIIPDRVHPGAGGHIVMAEALLRSWNAPALVSSVTLSVPAETAPQNTTLTTIYLRSQNNTQNAVVKDAVLIRGVFSWTQTDNALPFPLPTDPKDTAFTLALQSSDFVDALDKQMLTVNGLTAANYALSIDGAEVGTYTREQLAVGVNLATNPLTPMFQQAQKVSRLTRAHNNLHENRWTRIQVEFGKDKTLDKDTKKAIEGMDALEAALVKQQRAAAMPVPHRFVLAPKS